MEEQQAGVMNIAQEMATLSARSAQRANQIERELADERLASGRAQIDHARRHETAGMARAFASHQAASQANAAYRGVTAARSGAVASSLVASSEAANVRNQHAAREIALTLESEVQPRDLRMAAIQGGLEGLGVGTQIAQSLTAASREVDRTFRVDQTQGGLRTVGTRQETAALTPGFDLAEWLSHPAFNVELT